MESGFQRPVRSWRARLALALVVPLLAGGVAGAGDVGYWHATAYSYGSALQHTDFYASLYKQVSTPMPHWVEITGQQRHPMPFVSSRQVSPGYYEHKYYGEWEYDDFEFGGTYQIRVEYFDSVNKNYVLHDTTTFVWPPP